jgi:hypothetical protein
MFSGSINPVGTETSLLCAFIRSNETGMVPDVMHCLISPTRIELLTNETHVAKVNASDVITEICNVLWEHESCWN